MMCRNKLLVSLTCLRLIACTADTADSTGVDIGQATQSEPDLYFELPEVVCHAELGQRETANFIIGELYEHPEYRVGSLYAWDVNTSAALPSVGTSMHPEGQEQIWQTYEDVLPRTVAYVNADVDQGADIRGLRIWTEVEAWKNSPTALNSLPWHAEEGIDFNRCEVFRESNRSSIESTLAFAVPCASDQTQRIKVSGHYKGPQAISAATAHLIGLHATKITGSPYTQALNLDFYSSNDVQSETWSYFEAYSSIEGTVANVHAVQVPELAGYTISLKVKAYCVPTGIDTQLSDN